MAKDLGLIIVDARRQWVPPHSRVTNEKVQEVRTELYYLDLIIAPADWLSAYLIKQFATTIPNVVEAKADLWKRFGSQLKDLYHDLWVRPPGELPVDRGALVHQIRTAAEEFHGPQRGW
jgi:hypothetical protein